MEDAQRVGTTIRPVGVVEIIDTGIRLARSDYRRLALTVARYFVPLYAFQALLALAPKPVGVIGIVEWVVTSWAYVAIIIQCARLIDPSVGANDPKGTSVHQLGRRRAGYLMGLQLIMLIAAIPLFIVFPLGIYVLVRWAPAWIVVCVENVGPIQALRRGWRLTRRAWWHTFGVAAISGLVLIVLTILFGGFLSVGSMFALVGGSDVLAGVLGAMGNMISGVLVTPFGVGISVALYYELRARNEGFDIAARSAQVLPSA